MVQSQDLSWTCGLYGAEVMDPGCSCSKIKKQKKILDSATVTSHYFSRNDNPVIIFLTCKHYLPNGSQIMLVSRRFPKNPKCVDAVENIVYVF